MPTIADQLKTLKSKLNEYKKFLLETKANLTNLAQESKQEIQSKEQELENWRQKLEVLQQERNQIKKEIREKVIELEKSQLSNTEKQTKINKLLTEHSQELEEVDNLLYDERSQYRHIRDKLIAKLCQPCEICPEKERTVKILESRVNNLIGLVTLCIITSIFLFFLFLYSLYYHKRERERERERERAKSLVANSKTLTNTKNHKIAGWLV
jgi:chromosome segregation ATPase